MVTTLTTWHDVRELDPSERVRLLQARLDARVQDWGHRIFSDSAEAEVLREAIRRAYRATEGQPTVLRRARALTEYAQACAARCEPDDLLVGTQTFGPIYSAAWRQEDLDELSALGWAMTAAHVVHDYEGMLAHGVSGYREMIRKRTAQAPGEERVVLQAFSNALEAFATFVRRHADTAPHLAEVLAPLAEEPPRTFHQALQMVWFVHVFLHVENPGVAISFGRFDQYLWPFLEADLETGRLDLQGAFDLLGAFLLKCCEGEESQNLVLGGTDAKGEDATNPLSLLMLQAMRQLRTPQPSLTVRFHSGAPEEFVQAACELAAEGMGQPGFMNDAAVVPALQAAGVSLERARDWAVVGCYEAVPQGDCYPNTVFHCLHLVRLLSEYLHGDVVAGALDYPAFEAGWWEHVEAHWQQTLPTLEAHWHSIAEHAPSPFGSVVMRGCIEAGVPLEAGGTTHNFVGINMLGLGTLVDGLLAVEEVVFDQQRLTVEEMVEALDRDFPDEELRLQLLRRTDRYGTDSPRSNEKARSVSERLARLVLSRRFGPGVQPYPAFFAFAADIDLTEIPSPDGRRAQDWITYGAGPATSVRTTPTTVLRSASHVAHELCACGTPLAITLNAADLRGEAGAERIRHLVTTYFDLGGLHVHFNVTSAERLRRAQSDPVSHADLMVRVSGFSARFVTMDRRWQDALIERAERGL